MEFRSLHLAVYRHDNSLDFNSNSPGSLFRGFIIIIGSKIETSCKGLINSPNDVNGLPILQSLKPLLDTDKDGLPDLWKKNGLNPNNPNDRNNYHKNGYTMLEVYLSNLVQDGK